MTEAQVAALLRERGLARVAGRLMVLAEPTVRIFTSPVDEEDLPIGASKLGGRPDLPDGTAWPAWHEPMAFLGQINLGEAAPYDRAGALPRRGLLSFFYETNQEPLYSAGWGLPEGTHPDDYPAIDESRGWRVLYHEADPATFTRREPSPALNPDGRFPACAARFAAETSLPDTDHPTIRALGLTEPERLALIDLDSIINRGTWEEGGHRLLGYPYNLGGSVFVDCEVASRRLDYAWWASDAARWAELEDAALGRWRLLLQLDSAEDTAMDWAGGGILHICVPAADLPARDFSRVWISLGLV